MVCIDIKESGKKIHTMRVNKGFTATELAAALGGITFQSIYNWETGKCLPSIDNLVWLAKVFDTTVDELLVVKTIG